MIIDPKQIPDEAVEALRAATPGWHWVWNTEPSVASAIAAMLAAWPGVYRTDSALFSPALILPLTEARDGV